MTLAEAIVFRDACRTAYTNTLAGKRVSHNGRDLTYHDLEVLRAELDSWEKTVKDLEAAQSGATNPGVRIATWT